MTDLRLEYLTLPGARLGEENPLPHFRDPRTDLAVNALPSLPAEKREHLGWQAGFRVIREGEIALTDLWFELWARRVAAETGRPIDTELRAEVARLHPPPARIDFRMIGQ